MTNQTDASPLFLLCYLTDNIAKDVRDSGTSRGTRCLFCFPLGYAGFITASLTAFRYTSLRLHTADTSTLRTVSLQIILILSSLRH